MANYTVGKKHYEIDYGHARVLKGLVRQVASKLQVPSMESAVQCGMEINAEWLKSVLNEVERWYLDDFDHDGVMIVPAVDITKLKKLKDTLDEIVTQNFRKSEKFLLQEQAQKLCDIGDFLQEFVIDESDIIQLSNDAYCLPKAVLAELIKNVLEGIKAGKKITYSD